jgi:uncharacterized phage protein (TIGR02218 family)
MSRTVPAGLAAHLGGECLTLCTCVRITLSTGAVLAFTEHDRDIEVGGVTYRSALGYEAVQIDASKGLAVDQTEVLAVIDDDSLEEPALALGLFDGAEVEILLLNWADPAAGSVILLAGLLGEVRTEGNRYRAEIRSLSQRLQQTIGRSIMPECDVVEFADARCGLNAASYQVTSTVDTVTAERLAFTDAGLAGDAGIYTHGKLEWLTGANAGRVCHVAAHSAGAVQLTTPTPYRFQAGDQYRITQGCDRRMSTCRDRFGNLVNFRGFPHVPGADALMRIGR